MLKAWIWRVRVLWWKKGSRVCCRLYSWDSSCLSVNCSWFCASKGHGFAKRSGSEGVSNEHIMFAAPKDIKRLGILDRKRSPSFQRTILRRSKTIRWFERHERGERLFRVAYHSQEISEDALRDAATYRIR